MARLLGSLALAIVVAVAASAAGTAGSTSNTVVLIRHQVLGGHAWSVNGGPFAARHTLVLRRGSTVVFINNDVPHGLVELAGPHVVMRNGSTMPMGARMHGTAAAGVMNHMGATTTVRLTAPGVYRFRTHAD